MARGKPSRATPADKRLKRNRPKRSKRTSKRRKK